MFGAIVTLAAAGSVGFAKSRHHSPENLVQHAQLAAKLARLLEELREHGGNGHSAYAKRLLIEIAATRAQMDDLRAATPTAPLPPGPKPDRS